MNSSVRESFNLRNGTSVSKRFGQRSSGVDENTYIVETDARAAWYLTIQGFHHPSGLSLIVDAWAGAKLGLIVVCFGGNCVFGDVSNPDSFKQVAVDVATCFSINNDRNCILIGGISGFVVIDDLGRNFYHEYAGREVISCGFTPGGRPYFKAENSFGEIEILTLEPDQGWIVQKMSSE